MPLPPVDQRWPKFRGAGQGVKVLVAVPSAVHDELASRLTPSVLAAVGDLVPDEWLETTQWLQSPADARDAYVDLLSARLADPGAWLPLARS